MRNTKISLLKILLISTLSFTAVGCWDQRDVAEIAIVVAIGIDIDIDDEDIYEVTLQVVNPQALHAGGAGGGRSGNQEPVWTHSEKGRTTLEALRNSMSTVHRRPYIGHLQLIVLGEEMAKKGALDALQIFEREREARHTAFLLVAKGMKAKDILNVKSDLEEISAMHIVSILRNDTDFSKMASYNFFHFIRDMNIEGKHSHMGIIERRPPDAMGEGGQGSNGSGGEGNNGEGGGTEKEEIKMHQLRVMGSAAFKGDKLVGYLNATETRGLRFIEDTVTHGVIIVPKPKDKDKNVSVMILRSRGSFKVDFKDNKPVLIVEVDVEGNIASQHGRGDLTEPEPLKELEKLIAEEIKNEIISTVQKAQREFETDIFGFGEYLHKRHLKYWREVRDNWDEIFATLPMEVTAKVRIRDSGLFLQPSEPK